MQKPKSLMRIAAVMSSVTLFGGYVLHRAGVISFSGLSRAQAQVQAAGPSTQQGSGGLGTISLNQPLPESVQIMVSSKSAAVIPPASLVPPRTFLAGSKSKTMIIEPAVPAQPGALTLQPSPPAVDERRPAMSGSKSFILINHPGLQEGTLSFGSSGGAASLQPSTQPRAMMPGSKSVIISEPMAVPAAPVAPAPPAPATQPRVLMPGSKSNVHVIDGSVPVLFGDGHVDWIANPQPTTKPQNGSRTLLPGSKSLIPTD